MKKSTTVTLNISGALLAGCDRYNGGGWSTNDGSQPITNNTYVAGQGYWHAPYHAWYPFPYNSYSPTLGYYHGGLYSDAPEVSAVTSSAPTGSGSSGRSSSGSVDARRAIPAFRAGFLAAARGEDPNHESHHYFTSAQLAGEGGGSRAGLTTRRKEKRIGMSQLYYQLSSAEVDMLEKAANGRAHEMCIEAGATCD